MFVYLQKHTPVINIYLEHKLIMAVIVEEIDVFC